jgi:hypothetical protein
VAELSWNQEPHCGRNELRDSTGSWLNLAGSRRCQSSSAAHRPSWIFDFSQNFCGNREFVCTVPARRKGARRGHSSFVEPVLESSLRGGLAEAATMQHHFWAESITGAWNSALPDFPLAEGNVQTAHAAKASRVTHTGGVQPFRERFPPFCRVVGRDAGRFEQLDNLGLVLA